MLRNKMSYLTYLNQIRENPLTAKSPAANQGIVSKRDLSVYNETKQEVNQRQAEEVSKALSSLASSGKKLGSTIGSGFKKESEVVDVSPRAEEKEFDDVTGGETVDLSPNAERNEMVETSEPSVSNLKSFIIQYEGFRAKAYNDIDRLSIGYGSKATSKDQVISKEEAEKMLDADIKIARKSVLNAEKKYKYNFNDAQRDALTSFAYNAGGNNLLKLLDNGNRGLEEISNSFKLYNKGGGKVLPGLVKRRKAESNLFSMGYPTGEE